ncbi:MAG TPA: pitrilysin family protein [Candidatus Obscuribacterales bacterium]
MPERANNRKKEHSIDAIRTVRLPNGARIITEIIEGVYSASIGIWVDVGSEQETAENNGVSHCLEHMLFKGTEKRTAEDIAQEIEDVGGSLGAATGKENTCFYGRVMGDELGVAIDLLMDMLLNATLTDNDLDLERQVILEEIKMYEDDPEDLVHETLILNIWPGHPLSRPITGTRESVSRFSHEMLAEHVRRFYTAENMVLSIAGMFDEEKAIAQIAESLSRMRRGEPKPYIAPPAISPFTIIKYRDIEQAHISIATNGVSITDPKRYELSILDLCLGGNMSSRLFQEVRERRGLVYSINTFREAHRENGLLGVYAGTSPRNVQPVLELIAEEFRRVKQEGFTERELNRAKTQLKSDLLLGLESTRNRTTRNAYSELYYGRQLSVEEMCEEIDRVDAERVIAIARDLLTPDTLSMVIVGPRSGLAEAYSITC